MAFSNYYESRVYVTQSFKHEQDTQLMRCFKAYHKSIPYLDLARSTVILQRRTFSKLLDDGTNIHTQSALVTHKHDR